MPIDVEDQLEGVVDLARWKAICCACRWRGVAVSEHVTGFTLLFTTIFLVFLVLASFSCEYLEEMNHGPPPQLQRRNAEVFDSDGAVIAGTSFLSTLCLRR